MKKQFLFLLAVLVSFTVVAQSVGIGTATPNASSMLEIKASNKGLLIPRTSAASRTAIANPAKGLMVYDTTANSFWFHNGSAWTQVEVSGKGWLLTGNNGTNPATNFIGTTDAQPLLFRIRNKSSGIIDSANGNTAFGFKSFSSNTGGKYNTAMAVEALSSNISGFYNTATGFQALFSNTTGNGNTANGQSSLVSNTTGSYNTATGDNSLTVNTTGVYNTANGKSALFSNTTGADNTANGAFALYSNTTGYYNTGVGYDALFVTTGSQYNTAIGYNAGYNFDNGYNNVFVGANTGVNGANYYNVVAIGQGTVCTDVSQVTIGNSATTAYRAYANWSNISDGNFKKNVREDVPGLTFIKKLRPVTYTLDATGLDNFLHKNFSKENQTNDKAKEVMNKALQEKEQARLTGFVAQEVEKSAKELGFNFSGIDAPKNKNDVYGLRYSEFVVPLVKAVQELADRTGLQQQQIEALKNQNAELIKRIEALEKK